MFNSFSHALISLAKCLLLQSEILPQFSLWGLERKAACSLGLDSGLQHKADNKTAAANNLLKTVTSIQKNFHKRWNLAKELAVSEPKSRYGHSRILTSCMSIATLSNWLMLYGYKVKHASSTTEILRTFMYLDFQVKNRQKVWRSQCVNTAGDPQQDYL